MEAPPQSRVSPGCGLPLMFLQSNVFPMNQITPDEAAAQSLVEIIELKWLLAGQGFRLHVEQLQNDREYAQRTLEQAASVANPALREAAERVRRVLGLDAA